MLRHKLVLLVIMVGVLCQAQDIPDIGDETGPELAIMHETTYESAVPRFERWYAIRYLSSYDGDTLRADIHLGLQVSVGAQSIRLDGLDAPEVTGASKEQGIRARDFVRERLTAADEVVVLMGAGTGNTDKRDKYGRWIGTIYYRVGPAWYHLGEELISKGMATRRSYD